jgi:hypothetical protein
MCDTIYFTFLKWQNYKNENRLVVVKGQGWKRKWNKRGLCIKVNKRNFMVIEFFWILAVSISILWYCTLDLKDVTFLKKQVKDRKYMEFLCIISWTWLSTYSNMLY